MIILYKDDEMNLAVSEVTKAIYQLDEEALQISTPEDDFELEMHKPEAEAIIRQLYTEGKADATAYAYRDMYEEEDDAEYFDDDSDMEEEQDDFIDRMIELDMGIDGLKF